MCLDRGDVQGHGWRDRGGTLTVTRSAFLGNTGGAATAVVTRSVFSDNFGQDSAGAIFNFGVLTLEHCEFSHNGTFLDGGATFNFSQHPPDTLLVITSTFSNNFLAAVGGAILGSATIERSEFVGMTPASPEEPLEVGRSSFDRASSRETPPARADSGLAARLTLVIWHSRTARSRETRPQAMAGALRRVKRH